MKDSEKAILGVGIVAAAIAIGKAVKPPTDAPSATLEISIIDNATGLPVPHNSPWAMQEGGSYTCQVRVTNRTTRGGAQWAADFQYQCEITAALQYFGDDYLVPPIMTQEAFGAGQAKNFGHAFSVPQGSGGGNGEVNVSLVAPDGTIISAREVFTVSSSQIVYAADISIS